MAVGCFNSFLTSFLKVLLVTDPLVDSAAAALNVHAGHFSDPRATPGLAHFCEHMLFLGTTSFPKEGDFENYLSSAYTYMRTHA